jgi:uncharacterized caspase-like protein
MRLNSGALRLAKYAVALVALLPLAFGISFAIGRLAPEGAEAALGDTPVVTARTSSRLALLIANGDYPDANAPLRHPVVDARALADELRRNGFDVDMRENLGKDEMKRAFESFNARIRPGGVALVYFGGFGIQVDRQNYMIPVNATIWKEADIRRDGVSIDSVLADMHKSGATAKLAILDASRRNPFERRFRGFSAGLAAIDAPPGTLLLSSAALGKVADDSAGSHSLMIGELLKEINAPGVSAETIFNHTRIGVSRASNGEQIPLVSSSLVEAFAFAPGSPREPRWADRGDAAPPRIHRVETPVMRSDDAGATPAPSAADTKPDTTAATAKDARYDLASRPGNDPAAVEKPAPVVKAAPVVKPTPVVKETKARKSAEEAKPSRRAYDDASREIVHEQPRMIIRRGWYTSSFHPERPWNMANGFPRRAFGRPMLGFGF